MRVDRRPARRLGLGNALFIATALSVIVGSARGGVAGAAILHEAALGLGISVGPLLGGELGAISWRGPFFGVAGLMTVGSMATIAFLPRTPPGDHRVSVIEPLRALRHRAARGSGPTRSSTTSASSRCLRIRHSRWAPPMLSEAPARALKT